MTRFSRVCTFSSFHRFSLLDSFLAGLTSRSLGWGLLQFATILHPIRVVFIASGILVYIVHVLPLPSTFSNANARIVSSGDRVVHNDGRDDCMAPLLSLYALEAEILGVVERQWRCHPMRPMKPSHEEVDVMRVATTAW